MTTEKPIDAAGTPRRDHLFAAFNGAEEARNAMQALGTQYGEPSLISSPEDAQRLRGEGPARGLKEQVERSLKSFGGEGNVATHYGERLKAGCVVLAVPAPNRDSAIRAADQLKLLGAFDIAYFGPWTMEFFHGGAAAANHPNTTPHSHGDTTL